MNCHDCTRRLDALLDGELELDDAEKIQSHLSQCTTCRVELDSRRALLSRARALPREIPPARDLWPDLRAQLTGDTKSPTTPFGARSAGGGSSVIRWAAPLAMAATVVFLASIAERTLSSHSPSEAWSVAVVAGAPRVNARTVHDAAAFRLGQWLETDAVSRARVAVGSIGEVNVEPNSRLRLLGVEADDHRLELARGTLSAFIYAPPRLFFVNTPSATAVDLGCAYTLTVDDAGDGALRVSSGYVALEDGGRESIIRSGMMCFMRRGIGPGTPFAEDAPAELRTALVRFDFNRPADPAALRDVLAHAGADDVITLWHLLARTEGADRVSVFEALAKQAVLPHGVTREGILAGDAAMRRAWGAELGIDRF